MVRHSQIGWVTFPFKKIHNLNNKVTLSTSPAHIVTQSLLYKIFWNIIFLEKMHSLKQHDLLVELENLTTKIKFAASPLLFHLFVWDFAQHDLSCYLLGILQVFWHYILFGGDNLVLMLKALFTTATLLFLFF